MRLLRPIPAVLAAFLAALLLAPAAWAAPPQPMDFNGRPAATLPGAVTGLAVDGSGKWGAVSDADGGPTVTSEDRDLYMYSLESQGRAWEALDEDIVNDGGRLVAVSNGTGGQEGNWVVLVNNSVPSVLTGYRTSGFSAGQLGKLVWQFSPNTGNVRDIAINADGQVIAVAAEGASASSGGTVVRAAFLLIKNRQSTQTPLTLYRADAGTGVFNDVVAFTAAAVAMNTTIPAALSSERPVYSVAGAETELGGGSVFILEHTFAAGTDSSTTRVLFTFDTGTPVTKVAMTADGEYAVAGTQDGVVYLVSVREALARKGAQGLGDEPLRPWQGSLSSRIRALDIAPYGGAFFAAGTDGGEVAAFRNQRNAASGQGAQGQDVGTVPVTSVPCGSSALRGPVGSLALSDSGDHLVVGARNGVVGFEVGAVEQGRPGPLPAAWCFPLPSSDVQGPGVLVDMSGSGTRVFAASQNQVYGYRNFYQFGLTADADRKSGTPGQLVQWVVSVSNDGSLFDRVNLTLNGPRVPGWSFDVSPGSLSLLPGTSRQVLINVSTPPDQTPENFTLDLTAHPANAGPAFDVTQRLRLDLGRLRRVEVLVPAGVQVASPGVLNRIPLTIHNSGNARDRFRVSAEIPDPVDVNKSPGSEWQVRVNPFEIDVGPRSDGTVDLEVTPTAANRGDTANIRVRVEATVPDVDGSLISDQKTLQVAVEPEYRADLALRESKDYTVEPGGVAYINFTVKNLGNTRDILVVKNHTDPRNAPGWRLQLSDERFELRTQGATKIVQLTVVAQRGLQPGETVKVIAELFSEGLMRQVPGSDGQVDTQSVTVSVVAKQRTPMVAEPLVVLSVLALAWVGRRRGA